MYSLGSFSLFYFSNSPPRLTTNFAQDSFNGTKHGVALHLDNYSINFTTLVILPCALIPSNIICSLVETSLL